MLENTRQFIVALVVSAGMLLVVLELVRRRKLREEYSWLWIMAAVAMLVIGVSYDLLLWITELIGAGYTTSTLFFFGMVFLIALCLQFSVKISRLETQVKNLAQELAIREVREPEAK